MNVLIPDLSTPSGPNLLSENSICLVSGGWSENLSIVWTSDSVTVQNRREKGTPHNWLFCCTLCGPNSLSGSKQWTIEHPLINTNISPVTLAEDRGPPISVKTFPQEPVKHFSAKGFVHLSKGIFKYPWPTVFWPPLHCVFDNCLNDWLISLHLQISLEKRSSLENIFGGSWRDFVIWRIWNWVMFTSELGGCSKLESRNKVIDRGAWTWGTAWTWTWAPTWTRQSITTRPTSEAWTHQETIQAPATFNSFTIRYIFNNMMGYMWAVLECS